MLKPPCGKKTIVPTKLSMGTPNHQFFERQPTTKNIKKSTTKCGTIPRMLTLVEYNGVNDKHRT